MTRSILILFLQIPTFAQAATLTGVAKNRKGEVVYLEKHTIQSDSTGMNQFIRVEYSSPSGTVFATMTSDFTKSKNVPDTTFEDTRFNAKSTLKVNGNTVEFEEFRNSKSVSRRRVPLTESMVAGQGFDNFIRSNRDKLSSKPVQFKFGVIDRKDFYSLTGYKMRANSPEEAEFGIRASSWLVQLFAHELKVVYEAKRMRLKTFVGRSNIPDDSGKTQDVVIDYQWSDES